MAKSAAQKAAEETLKKAQEAAASRAGKTTEERLAAMKAEREKKLAEQKAARPTGAEAINARREAQEIAENRKFEETMQKSYPAGGAGGVIGSSVAQWLIDPKTGKKRTPQQIIDAVTEAVLADKTPGGISIDPITGKQQSWTPAEKVRAALGQLAANAKRESKDLDIADKVFKALKGDGRGAASSSLANKPETWLIGKDKVGTVVDRKIFDEPNAKPNFIIDPTKNQLTPEQLKQFKEIGLKGGFAVDPVSGFQVLIDDQGRYTLGQQPVPTGDTRGMDYSKYIPGVNEADYGMAESPNITEEPVDENNTIDNRLIVDPNRGNPNQIVIDPVTGKPVVQNLGTGTGSTTGLTAPQYNERMGVYAAMADRFNKYGLTGLAEKIKQLAIQGATEATITLQLQETPEYQQRFAANADRIKRGLAALTPAEYVNTEDSYRQVLRAYGLKQFDNDAYVRQFIANDMSPTELSNRVVTAVQRVQNADPAIIKQLKDYYGIGAPDMVAYVLDPEQQFQKIERQIAASEIGVAAGRQGLTAGVSVAEQLAAQGVSEAEARKGYATIADILPTAEKLSDIYGGTLAEYRQAEGEQEVFNSLASAQRKRQALSAREAAAFSGSSGVNKASLTTSNVGKFQNPERTYRPRQRNRPIVGASQFPRTELWPAN